MSDSSDLDLSDVHGDPFVERATWKTIELPPGPAGAWQIGETPYALIVNIKHRPRWLTRLAARWLLEWRWIDARRDWPC